jgi:K+-sensing histidine kinase KdpD
LRPVLLDEATVTREQRTTTEPRVIDLVERDAVELLAVAAHELRTPLTAILGYSETLVASRHQMKVEAVDAAIVALDRQAHRLANLLDELLVLGSYRQNPQRQEHVHLDDIVTDALETAVPPDTVNVARTSTADGSLVVRGERTALARVVVNLLTNAYRYGGRNVIVTCRNGDTGLVEIVVEDDGEGVPREVLGDLFSPFVRGPAPAGTEMRPVGLGLAVATAITETAGGTLRHQRVSPTGARFIMSLPLASLVLR